MLWSINTHTITLISHLSFGLPSSLWLPPLFPYSCQWIISKTQIWNFYFSFQTLQKLYDDYTVLYFLCDNPCSPQTLPFHSHHGPHKQLVLFEINVSHPFFSPSLSFFLMFIYSRWERERERERELKQAPCYQGRARCRAQSHEPLGQDLSWNQDSDTQPNEPPRHPLTLFKNRLPLLLRSFFLPDKHASL